MPQRGAALKAGGILCPVKEVMFECTRLVQPSCPLKPRSAEPGGGRPLTLRETSVYRLPGKLQVLLGKRGTNINCYLRVWKA